MALEATMAHLDDFIAHQMRRQPIPGLALALTDRTQLLRVATYGLADRAAQTPVTPDTLFEIGSIGKSFTSIALLQQHEAGHLDLQAPVTTYLPWLTIPSPYAPITLHHLLSHTAGITRGTDLAPGTRFEVAALRAFAPGFPPGTRFHYSNVGYKALGYLLEETTQRPFAEILQTGILDPLAMQATHPVITYATRPQLAVGYRPAYDDRPWHARHPLVPAPWHEYGAGDGSLASTPADMAAYVRMLLNRGQGPHRRLLQPASFDRLVEHVIEAWPGSFYGYGLSSEEVDGHTCVGHGGGTLGFGSTILADMDAGLGVVVLCNSVLANPGAIAQYALTLLRAASRGEGVPAMPPDNDVLTVEHPDDYSGTYRAGAKTLTLVAEDRRLLLQHGDAHIPLEPRGPDTFFVNDPHLGLFLLRFGRSGGQVVEAFFGPTWYTNDNFPEAETFDAPATWAPYVGHYRAHNPWLSNFRIVLRKGELALIYPWGNEEPLVPLEEAGSFQVGVESPERIQFDTLIAGQTLRANLSGCDYYRFFTP